MRRTVVLAAAACFVAATVQAATVRQQCFSSADIEADQAITFQTQLMVVSDICTDPVYTQFTQRNREAIASYQKQLIDHFRRSGDGAAERSFDNYMTRIANQKALASGRQPVAQVCQGAAAMMATAKGFRSADDFRKFAASQAVANRGNYQACN